MANELIGGILPRTATQRERTLWAALAAITGIAHDGSMDRAFQRVQAAAQTFGAHEDALLKRFGFWYHRQTDCYVSREDYYGLLLQDVQVGCRRLAH
jgi:hypothetical protein